MHQHSYILSVVIVVYLLYGKGIFVNFTNPPLVSNEQAQRSFNQPFELES
jgi:hypothetical protein